MYLIKKGSVAIRKMKGSAYVEIARVYSNEVIGELSFFDRQPRSAAAVALTEVEALEIAFTSLDKIYDKVPPYIKSIIVCIADRLRRADDTIRRLQKIVVTDEPDANGRPGDDAGPDTAAILAATADIPFETPSGDDSDDGAEDPNT